MIRDSLRAPLVRALAPGVLVLLLAACGSGDSTSPPPPPEPALVTIGQDTIELTALGDSMAVQVMVRRGQRTINAALTWWLRSTEPASVSQQGFVRARLPGSTWILAASDSGGLDSAVVLVRPTPVEIILSPEEHVRPIGRAFTFEARAYDRHGNLIPRAPLQWESLTPGIATVDSAGRVVGIAVGETTIRASAGDVSGEARLHVNERPALIFVPDTILLGPNQEAAELSIPRPVLIAEDVQPGERVVVQMRSDDPSIASSPDVVDVPMHATEERRFVVRSGQVGETILRASAPGWRDTFVVVRVRRGKLRWHGPNEVQTGEFGDGWVGAHDSAGAMHRVTTPLNITSTSLSPAVVRTSLDNVVVEPGLGGASFALAPQSHGEGRIVFSAPGYDDDTIHVTVRSPKVRLTNRTIGARQWLLWEVGPWGVSNISVTHLRPEVGHLGAIGQTHFNASGLATGTDTFIVSAPGYEPDTAILIVTTPRLILSPTPAILHYYGLLGLTVTSIDSLGISRELRESRQFDLTPANPSLLTPRSAVFTISSGQFKTSVFLDPSGLGTTSITVSDRDGIFPAATTAPIQIVPNPVQIGFNGEFAGHYSLGFRQSLANKAVFAVMHVGGSEEIGATVRSTNPAIATVAVGSEVGSTVESTGLFDIRAGDVPGTAWIVVEGTGLATDSVQVRVSRPTTSLYGPATLRPNTTQSYVVVLLDGEGQPRTTTETVTFDITSTDPNVLGSLVNFVTVNAGESTSISFPIQARRAGTAAIRISDRRQVPWRYDDGSRGIPVEP